jgi:ectoine hydroxylase-related dioxygenase (phytanoyl-CoA dioxygenase family)
MIRAKKPAILKNEALQNEFDENGFVKFRLFNEAQMKRIHQFYIDTQTEHETIAETKKFHATNETSNAELIAKSDQFIKSVMLEEIDKYFFNYKIIAANYLIKQSDQASELGPHQDLRFVDEQAFYSFNIWVATEATNKQNGCLRFVKGSHLWCETVRALPSYPWKYRNVYNELADYFTDIETEVGDCVILNHACIHSSYPNLSNKIRVAAIMAMIPDAADIRHYFLPNGNPENEVEEYTMTLQDFITLKVGHRPESAPLVRTFKYDFSPIDITYFESLVKHLKRTPAKLNSYEQLKQKLSTLFKFA